VTEAWLSGLAALPLAAIFVLMLGFRWSAARAGLVGYGVALALAWFVFGLDGAGLAVAHGKALLLSLDVLLIVWMAYLFYRVVDEAGAIQALAQAIARLTDARAMQALLLAWAFASFLQSMGGFGVPVAVVAPLLVSLGFSPLQAVVLPSVGHGWAVSFGSLATAFRALVATTGWPGDALAGPTAGLLGAMAILTGLLIAHAAAGWAGVRGFGLPALGMGVTMAGVQFALARAGLWTVAALGGSLAGLVVGLAWARWATPTPSEPVAFEPALDWRWAAAGYGILIAVVLLIQFVPSIHASLSAVRLTWSFPAVTTRLGYQTPAAPGKTLVLLRHTGARLLYAALLTAGLYAWRGFYRPGVARRVVRATLRGTRKATFGILTMMAMALVMQHAGMTDALARGLAALTGAHYPWVAPLLGVLSAFMTGSNTNGNVLFGWLQRRTAEVLGLSVTWILAAQTAGAAIGSVAAPAKIIVGASTTRAAKATSWPGCSVMLPY